MSDQPHSSGYTVASDSELPGGGEDSGSSFPQIDAAVGIDLGSSSCSVAVWRNSQVEILANPLGLKRMPSHVLFKSDIPCSGVSSVISDSELSSGSAIYHAKSLVGRVDTDKIVENFKNFPFLVQTMDIGVRPFLAALVNGVWRSTTPEEVIAIVLLELRAMAEAELGRTVRSAVLTMPASFSRFQETRLERACAMAGLQVLRLMPEATAVALVYAQQQQQATQDNMGSGIEKNVFIFNMGAGFCDLAVATTAGGVSQIRALTGDSIGAEVMVQNLIRYLLAESETSPPPPPPPQLKRLGGSNLLSMASRSAQLRPLAEKAMHTLSTASTALVEGEIEGKRFSRTITREAFERVNADIIQKCESLAHQCLSQAQISVDNLDDIIVAGGCSKIPAIRDAIQRVCGGKPFYEGIDPLEAAVRGAALEGAIASGVTDSSGLLDLLTIQAMPHSLGIRLAGNAFVPVLHKNVAIPARRDIVVTTKHDDQAEALIIVYEGEAKQANENHLLGFFKVIGIPAAPAGVPLVNVCMDVDASDVLRVVVGVCMPGAEKPVVPLVEVRMPTVDDGHGWCADVILSRQGPMLELDYVHPTQVAAPPPSQSQ